MAERPSPGWLLLILPAGFLFGLMGGFVQEIRLDLGPVAVPIGVLVTVGALVSIIRVLSLILDTRLAGSLFYGGWLLGTGLLTLPTNSGDVVFTTSLWPVVYLLSGAFLGAAMAAWPLRLTDVAALPQPVTTTGGIGEPGSAS